MTSRRVKGANLGPRQNCGRVEEGKRAARSSDCSARGIGLAEAYQEDERRRSATGCAQKKEARRGHSRGQEAAVTGDEETLGRAPQKVVLNLLRWVRHDDSRLTFHRQKRPLRRIGKWPCAATLPSRQARRKNAAADFTIVDELQVSGPDRSEPSRRIIPRLL